jgi:hypothetical protein
MENFPLVIFHFSFSIEIKERGQATLPNHEIPQLSRTNRSLRAARLNFSASNPLLDSAILLL